jgi:decaprenylphospho-beta-D-ribofuranose 2-oxidase
MGESKLSGWGRQQFGGTETTPESLREAPPVLFRGLGRSYGDSSLPPGPEGKAVNTTRANRILSFDEETLQLSAEAGLALSDLNRVFLPKGYFVPVTPGTQFVTLGGMVAADVHGKNHHVDGCIGQHVRSLTMRLANGDIVTCSRERMRDLFLATIGGMGLTGQILEVTFDLKQIPSPWIWQESERVANIDEYIEKLKTAAKDWPMTVGWIDCLSGGASLGRGFLMKGRWATPTEAREDFPKAPLNLRFPFVAPEFVLGRATVKAFNAALYWKHFPKVKTEVMSPFNFFYPLDFVKDWNLMYGRRGFTQYQCVLPNEAGPGAARRFLNVLTAKGGASFLCVIKDCGPEGDGMLSFPKPGISIALDIAVRDETQALIDALNEQVLTEGGRIYLAKDSYTRPEHFRAMEPRLDSFLKVRAKYDPTLRFRSAQSVRLFGDDEVKTERAPAKPAESEPLDEDGARLWWHTRNGPLNRAAARCSGRPCAAARPR